MSEPNGNCAECGYRKGMMNKAKGMKIDSPIGGKCTRPGGYCPAHIDTYAPVPRYQRAEDVPQEPDEILDPLSEREKKRLLELESVVVRNFQAFYDVGMALKEINESRLYRETHGAFSDYCKDIFEISRPRAYQLIDAAKVVEIIKIEMSPIGDNTNVSTIVDTSKNDNQKSVTNWSHFQTTWLPSNEAQARALVKVPPEKLPEVCREAVATAPDGKVTARHIKKTLKNLKLIEVKQITAAARDETADLSRKEKIGAAFKEAYDAFMAAVQAEIDSDWRHTDRSAVLRHMRILYGVIERDY